MSAETSQPLDFIENKAPDFERVRELLEPSREANHWANGGPLSARLERTIETLLAPRGTRAVVCSSGTAALMALTGLHEYRAGRPLRWAGSAFAFLSSFAGKLADGLLVDCDERGLLDLEALACIPEDRYDGVLVTNAFGLYTGWTKYDAFCRARGKELIVDNAACFPRAGSPVLDGVPHFLSFHQTKPWGAGEGGCVLVAEEHEDTVRRLLNFGAGLEPAARPSAFNGKISDLSCAYILDRLERFADWACFYEAQRARVIKLVEEAGLPLRPLTDPEGCGPIGHMPLLASLPVSMTDLQNEVVVLRKYYVPGADGFPRAQQLYDRMINVPCHPDMAILTDRQIVNALASVVHNASRRSGIPLPAQVDADPALRAGGSGG
ncbi:hypothetical protein ABI59_13300 [Acidobacteria bacterium Mor1]|nr:hypothetical protein ABI59_13300 [Acidobacteria bacterium Mor1]